MVNLKMVDEVVVVKIDKKCDYSVFVCCAWKWIFCVPNIIFIVSTMVDSAWNPLSFLWHSLEVFGMLLKDGENFEKIFVFFSIFSYKSL